MLSTLISFMIYAILWLALYEFGKRGYKNERN